MKQALDQDFRLGSLIRFALPTAIMMLFTSLYTIVDGIFVSQFVGADALASINIVYPVVSIALAVGIMLSTGGSAVVAHAMGEGKRDFARKCFSFLTLVGVLAGVVLTVVCLFFLDPVCMALGSTPELLEDCRNYLRITAYFAPTSMLQVLFQSFFVAAGRPGLGLTVSILAGVTNAVLDYVFIVPLQMGISGAALATGIGAAIPAVVGVLYFFFSKGELRFARPKFYGRALLKSCGNGSSEMVSNLSIAVTTFLFNILMLQYLGKEGVSAITIALYSQFLLTALFIGFSMGVAPVISFNHGSGNDPRLQRVFKISIRCILLFSLVMFALALLGAETISRIFVSPADPVYPIAVHGLQLFSTGYLFAGINIFASALFTALSNGRISALISLLRTFVFVVITLLLLPLAMGADGIWLAVPFGEFLACIVAFAFILRHRRTYHYASYPGEMMEK